MMCESFQTCFLTLLFIAISHDVREGQNEIINFLIFATRTNHLRNKDYNIPREKRFLDQSLSALTWLDIIQRG